MRYNDGREMMNVAQKLKEIRINKGLTQVEAAEAIGVSRRTYQTFEKEEAVEDFSKYEYCCEKLAEYEPLKAFSLRTNAVYGKDLKALTSKVRGYRKRFCFEKLLRYMKGDYRGAVCILYGLRRTGKTTMLFQLINTLDENRTAYIKVSDRNTMADLVKDIDVLRGAGFRNIIIDEITLLEDFIDSAAVLSDIYSMMGLKIVLSGTDSLGFAFSDREELFDRNLMIRTSYISFREFYEVLGIKDIDTYIEYGGTLKAENISFDDPDYNNEETAFRDDESTRKYIDSAIAGNIQRSLRNSRFGTGFVHLRQLYEKGELTNAINRIIQSMNHDFLVSVIEEKFRSSDLGSARQLLLKSKSPEVRTALYDVDTEKVTERLKELIGVREKEDLSVPVDAAGLAQIKSYLYALDLIKDVSVVYDDGSEEKRVVFTQPGMRYSITKALVYSLMADAYFGSMSFADRQAVIEKILSDVKGRMLEDIVILEKTLEKGKNRSVFKYRSLKGGEIDLVLFDAETGTCGVNEIKYSKTRHPEAQARFLTDAELTGSLERKYGRIAQKRVLYRGEAAQEGDIAYINVEDYLIS